MAKNRLNVEIFQFALVGLLGDQFDYDFDERREAHRWNFASQDTPVATVEMVRRWLSTYKLLNGSVVAADANKVMIVARPAK